MPNVWLVQETLERSVAGGFRPKFSTAAAEEFGTVRYILNWSETRPPWHEFRLWNLILERTAPFRSDDFLVPCGNPALIMLVSRAICARLQDTDSPSPVLKTLVWDNRRGKYDLFALDLSRFPTFSFPPFTNEPATP